MSYDYLLVGRFPFADPETESVDRVAAMLRAPVTRAENGDPRVVTDAMWVHGLAEDDESSRHHEETYGIRSNLSLIFTPVGDDALVRAHWQMFTVADAFAGVADLEAVLATQDEEVMARIGGGRLTPESAYWDGWPLGRDILAAWLDGDPGRLGLSA